ncbi:MAG: hypothetical protein KA807_19025, partial [Prolixibacteraceae bacterium]|nr:hypothetical protein [Prolixibacteraceae bacterium]
SVIHHRQSGFFIPPHDIEGIIFFLLYHGHFGSVKELESLPYARLLRYHSRLKNQLDYEKAEIEKARNKT